MNTFDDAPRTAEATLAAEVRAARSRGAYAIETLAELARVNPMVIHALEDGATITDSLARDRVLDVLGLRPGNPRRAKMVRDLTRPRGSAG